MLTIMGAFLCRKDNVLPLNKNKQRTKAIHFGIRYNASSCKTNDAVKYLVKQTHRLLIEPARIRYAQVMKDIKAYTFDCIKRSGFVYTLSDNYDKMTPHGLSFTNMALDKKTADGRAMLLSETPEQHYIYLRVSKEGNLGDISKQGTYDEYVISNHRIHLSKDNSDLPKDGFANSLSNDINAKIQGLLSIYLGPESSVLPVKKPRAAKAKQHVEKPVGPDKPIETPRVKRKYVHRKPIEASGVVPEKSVVKTPASSVTASNERQSTVLVRNPHLDRLVERFNKKPSAPKPELSEEAKAALDVRFVHADPPPAVEPNSIGFEGGLRPQKLIGNRSEKDQQEARIAEYYRRK